MLLTVNLPGPWSERVWGNRSGTAFVCGVTEIMCHVPESGLVGTDDLAGALPRRIVKLGQDKDGKVKRGAAAETWHRGVQRP